MTDYSRCSTIVLFLLGLGFVIAGIVLVIVSDGIITSSVKKVEKNRLRCFFF